MLQQDILKVCSIKYEHPALFSRFCSSAAILSFRLCAYVLRLINANVLLELPLGLYHVRCGACSRTV
jgi:hypothetical protein